MGGGLPRQSSSMTNGAMSGSAHGRRAASDPETRARGTGGAVEGVGRMPAHAQHAQR